MSPADPPAPAAADDDATLVARCRAGERAAWVLLVQRYQRLVHAIVRRAGCDEHTAADVFQTVFTRLLAHLPTLREPDRLQAWIVTTAKREVLGQLQRARRHRPLEAPLDGRDGADGETAPTLADTLADEAPLADAVLDALQQEQRLRDAMARLDPRCRTLLELLFRDDDDAVPYQEIGRRLDMPVGSIGPTRARCLARLRALFGDAG